MTARLIGLCMGFGAAAALAAPVSVAALDETDMFPFVPSYDAPGNVVNMSHLLDAPAGKHGRIRVEGGRFVNDRGRVRLHATNLTGPANFPTHEEAERLAARLARFGVNCVRLHYFDSSYGTFMLPAEPGILAEDFRTRRRFDPERRDRQDYLVAQFKKHGIYVDVNLHVARTLDARDGFAPGTPWANKGVDQFDPRIIAEEKAYAKELLEHVNPYTGLSYLKDPVVAVVELNNEDALWNQYLGGALDNLGQPYATVFKNLWNDWLVRKYATDEALRAAWKLARVPPGEEMVPEGRFDGEVKPDGKTWILDKGSAQAAVAAHEVVRIPASERPYYVDATVRVPSNRRIEAAGATVALLPGTCVLMLRNEHAPDGTLAPIPPGSRDRNIAVVGGRWEDWMRARRGYGATGRFDLAPRKVGAHYGVSTLFYFGNCDAVTVRDATFVHTSGFAVQAGDGAGHRYERIRFEACHAGFT